MIVLLNGFLCGGGDQDGSLKSGHLRSVILFLATFFVLDRKFLSLLFSFLQESRLGLRVEAPAQVALARSSSGSSSDSSFTGGILHIFITILHSKPVATEPLSRPPIQGTFVHYLQAMHACGCRDGRRVSESHALELAVRLVVGCHLSQEVPCLKDDCYTIVALLVSEGVSLDSLKCCFEDAPPRSFNVTFIVS